MSSGFAPRVGEVSPTEAWKLLETDRSARLIDVRTRAEWGYVGVPDLSEIGQTLICVEWAMFPEMSINPRFTEAVTEELGDERPGSLLFICRSGKRSLAAARAMADHLASRGETARCLSVAEGFEGDLDPHGHRGCLNGWKFRGLAWRQS